MRYVGTVNFHISRQKVWEALLNPDEIIRCVPGLLNWRVLPNHAFSLQVAWKTAGKYIKLPLLLEWVDQRPRHFLSLKGRMDFSSSQIIGTGEMRLTAVSPTHTQLHFTAVITTPHKITDHIVHTAVPQIIATFFKCLKTHLNTG